VIDGPAAIVDAALARERPGRATTVLGITGSVAVGKSTIAAAVADDVQARGKSVEVISTDAFLLPNATLVDRGLLMRKGFPESYDHVAMRALVDALHAGTKGATVPVYSHLLFDVVPGDGRTLADADIVVIEGVNVLAELHDVLDLSVYIDAPEELVEQWYVERFHRLCREAEHDEQSFYRQFVGMSSEQIDQLARRTWEGINLVNLRENIAPSRALADLVVTMGTGHEVVSVNSREDSPP
jgi:type I pantothenate kinase